MQRVTIRPDVRTGIAAGVVFQGEDDAGWGMCDLGCGICDVGCAM